MRNVVIKTAEPDSTKYAPKIMVKNLDSTYSKAYPEQVADNATQMNAEEINILLGLIN